VLAALAAAAPRRARLAVFILREVVCL